MPAIPRQQVFSLSAGQSASFDEVSNPVIHFQCISKSVIQLLIFQLRRVSELSLCNMSASKLVSQLQHVIQPVLSVRKPFRSSSFQSVRRPVCRQPVLTMSATQSAIPAYQQVSNISVTPSQQIVSICPPVVTCRQVSQPVSACQ